MPGGGECVFNSDLACNKIGYKVSKMINVLPIVGCAAESLNKRV